MIKNIVFDWNGVISNGLNVTYCATNKALEILGAEKISLEEFRKEWEQPYMPFWNKYLPDLTLEEENEAFFKALPGCPEQEVYPGVKEVLKNFLEKRIKMVVISGDYIHFVQRGLKKFGLKEDIFVDYACNVHDKLNDLKEIIKKNNFNPAETLIIGDTTHETEIGKKLQKMEIERLERDIQQLYQALDSSTVKIGERTYIVSELCRMIGRDLVTEIRTKAVSGSVNVAENTVALKADMTAKAAEIMTTVRTLRQVVVRRCSI